VSDIATATAVSLAAGFDPRDDQFRQERYASYAAMREHSPVHHCADLGIWLIFRAEDVNTVLRHPMAQVAVPADVAEVFEPLIPPPLLRFLKHMLLFIDEPDHSRVRGIVQQAFGPRSVKLLRDDFHRRVVEAMDGWRVGQEVDLVNEFAAPLFLQTICHLLGVPSEDHGLFRQWTHDIDRMIDVPIPLQDVGRASDAASGMADYLDGVVAQRSLADPGADLLGALLTAEVEGERMDHDELLATAALLLIAGHDTTVSLITNAVHSLLTHPDELRSLVSDPALVPSAIEEVLRFQSPLQMATGGGRFMTEAIELGGHRIEPGERIMLVLGSANRDANVFADPDRFDVRRPPNRHLAFGKGAHFCLGAMLARMEGEVVLREMLERFPATEPAEDPATLRWLDLLPLRQLERLPVRLG